MTTKPGAVPHSTGLSFLRCDDCWNTRRRSGLIRVADNLARVRPGESSDEMRSALHAHLVQVGCTGTVDITTEDVLTSARQFSTTMPGLPAISSARTLSSAA